MSSPSAQLIFLGTGTGVPSAERASPAILLKLPNLKVLIDIGPGTLRQLAKISVSITEIDYILLTHLHPDHSADLVPFLFAGKYPPYLQNRRPCHLFAGSDFNTFHKGLQNLYGHWIEWPTGLFRIFPLPQDRPWEKEFSDFSLLSSPVPHSSSSLGYRITLPDRKVLVFSGDSDYSTSLVELAQKADLLVCECSFSEEEKMDGHLIPSLAGRIAREAGVGKLILTHFYPECQGRDLISPCAREYSGPILLAEDFQSVLL
ncbi:MAG: MBL fold metallo-hydrolase [Desulfobacca sp.]|nr:MBL fold metallo-hydrolase [Desulfobacca sp.]